MPVLLGTNVILSCYLAGKQRFGASLQQWPWPPPWILACYNFVNLADSVQQTVSSPVPQRVPANSKVLIPCKIQTSALAHKVTVMTDGGEISLPAGLLLSSSIADLQPGESMHTVSVSS